MAEKELRRMNRTELIEIIYALQQNGKTIQQENEELHRQLDDKTIRIENAGSIAEAALSLNRIFEDAEAAAQQYLESIRIAAAEREALWTGEDAEGNADANVLGTETSGMQTGLTEEVSDADMPWDEEMPVGQEDNDWTEAEQQGDAILEKAQEESARLLEEAQQENARLLEETQQQCDQMVTDTQQQCGQMVTDTQQQCDQMVTDTREQCDQMLAAAQQESDGIRREANEQAQNTMDVLFRDIRRLLEKYPVLAEYLGREFGAEDDTRRS